MSAFDWGVFMHMKKCISSTHAYILYWNETRKGSMWSIPYAQSPPREDVDKSGSYCLVYDVIFHPETLSQARKDKQLRDKLENTAVESVEKSFKLTLDKNNVKKPKLRYLKQSQAWIYMYVFFWLVLSNVKYALHISWRHILHLTGIKGWLVPLP